MAKKVQPLTATQVKQAQPKEKEYNLGDGGGLKTVHNFSVRSPQTSAPASYPLNRL